MYVTFGSEFFPGPAAGFTLEQQQKIVQALSGKLRACPACGKVRTWQLITDGVVNMPVGSVPYTNPYTPVQTYPNAYAQMFSQPRSIPCIVLVCTNCGNLQFHHVLTLGLGPVLGITGPLVSTGEGE